MDILDLTKESAHSKLLNFIATQNEITLLLYHDNLEKNIEIKFPSDHFYTNFSPESEGICYLNCELISEVLSIKNGVYIPHENFVFFMNEVRQGLHILYGLRQSQYQFFFSCNGSFTFLLPLKSIEKVMVKIL